MSYRVYPTVKTDTVCNDYKVFFDGVEVETNTARVSAAPINRRWPGHQREISQTETVQFLSGEISGPVEVTVKPAFEYNREDLRIRPSSLGIAPTFSEDGAISFTLEKPCFVTVEPLERSRALHLFIDKVKEYSPESGREVIYYGPGEHDVGVIELKSNQTVFIDAGAVVYARIEGTDCENVSIIGRGILDNSRNKEIILYDANVKGNDRAVTNAKRHHTVLLKYCKNILIDGITIRDSLVYNIRPIGCVGVTVREVKIIGCWRYNSDGIDMHNCRDVEIYDCFIRTYDDSICVKGYDFFQFSDPQAEYDKSVNHGGGKYDTFENTTVKNCVIWNDWGKALEIGAETMAKSIHGIHFSNCDLIHLTAYAIDCMNVDFAEVYDISFENIRIEADDGTGAPLIQREDGQVYENPIAGYQPKIIAVSVESHHEYSAIKGLHGKNHDFLFKDISVTCKKPPKLIFFGYSEEYCTKDITVKNLRSKISDGTETDSVDLEVRDFAYGITFEK